MTSPRLGPDGKTAFLEQFLRLKQSCASKTFPGIMFAKREFVALASFQSIYSIEMKFLTREEVSFSFEYKGGKQSSGQIKLPVEKARRLFWFLNPNLLYTSNYYERQQEFSDFLKDSEYKIGIRGTGGSPISSDFISPIWSRISELSVATDQQIRTLGTLPINNFDKLTVAVKSVDCFEHILRHNIKSLVVNMPQPLSVEGLADKISSFAAGQIESCEIKRRIYSNSPEAVPLVKGLVQKLRPRRFDLWVKRCGTYGHSGDDLINSDISMVAEVAKVINAAKIRSNIGVYDHYNYPTASNGAWIQRVKNDPVFKNVKTKFGKSGGTCLLKCEIGDVCLTINAK